MKFRRLRELRGRLGYAVAAREVMCVDPQVRAAMAQAGTPCAQDQTVAAKLQATAEYEGAAPAPVALQMTSIPATSVRGCHRNYQLLGGWYDVCPSTGPSASAPANTIAGSSIPGFTRLSAARDIKLSKEIPADWRLV